MKNKLGHDNISEVKTVITRMRENKFEITKSKNNEIEFRIIIHQTTLCANVSLKNTLIINFTIERKINGYIYDYFIEQKNGIPKRKIKLLEGYIIWSLLEEKLIE